MVILGSSRNPQLRRFNLLARKDSLLKRSHEMLRLVEESANTWKKLKL